MENEPNSRKGHTEMDGSAGNKGPKGPAQCVVGHMEGLLAHMECQRDTLDELSLEKQLQAVTLWVHTGLTPRLRQVRERSVVSNALTALQDAVKLASDTLLKGARCKTSGNVYKCSECAAELKVPYGEDVWAQLQTHQHIERAFSEKVGLSKNLEKTRQSVTSSSSSVSSHGSNASIGSNQSIGSNHSGRSNPSGGSYESERSNQSTGSGQASTADSHETVENHFQNKNQTAPLTLQTDELFNPAIYPEKKFNVDKGAIPSIQKVGDNLWKCLMCRFRFQTQPKAMQHLYLASHVQKMKNFDLSQALISYHLFWQNSSPSEIRNLQVFFDSADRQRAKCVACKLIIPYEEIFDHVQDPVHQANHTRYVDNNLKKNFHQDTLTIESSKIPWLHHHSSQTPGQVRKIYQSFIYPENVISYLQLGQKFIPVLKRSGVKRFWCMVCFTDVSTNSALEIAAHVKGSKHTSALLNDGEDNIVKLIQNYMNQFSTLPNCIYMDQLFLHPYNLQSTCCFICNERVMHSQIKSHVGGLPHVNAVVRFLRREPVWYWVVHDKDLLITEATISAKPTRTLTANDALDAYQREVNESLEVDSEEDDSSEDNSLESKSSGLASSGVASSGVASSEEKPLEVKPSDARSSEANTSRTSKPLVVNKPLANTSSENSNSNAQATSGSTKSSAFVVSSLFYNSKIPIVARADAVPDLINGLNKGDSSEASASTDSNGTSSSSSENDKEGTPKHSQKSQDSSATITNATTTPSTSNSMTINPSITKKQAINLEDTNTVSTNFTSRKAHYFLPIKESSSSALNEENVSLASTSKEVPPTSALKETTKSLDTTKSPDTTKILPSAQKEVEANAMKTISNLIWKYPALYPSDVPIMPKEHGKFPMMQLRNLKRATFRCLVCLMNIGAKTKRRRKLDRHCRRPAHIRQANNRGVYEAVKSYFKFWFSAATDEQKKHQIYFDPANIGMMNCVLCNDTMYNFVVATHLESDRHKEQIELVEIILTEEESQESDDDGPRDDIADNSNRKGRTLSEPAGTSRLGARGKSSNEDNMPEREGPVVIPQKIQKDHDIIRAVTEDLALGPVLGMLENRYKEHLKLLTDFGGYIKCTACTLEMPQDIIFVRAHLDTPEHRKHSALEKPGFKLMCGGCFGYFGKAASFYEHIAKKCQTKIKPIRLARFEHFECRTCRFAIYGDERTLMQHFSHSKLQRQKREVKLNLPFKRILDNIEREAAELNRQSEEMLSSRNAMDKLLKSMETCLRPVYPGCMAYGFGSRVTGLGNKYSDLDVFLDIGNMYLGFHNQDSAVQKKIVYKVASKLYSLKGVFSRVTPIASARTPIVQVHYDVMHIDCDLSFRHGLSVENSGYVRNCIFMQPQLKPLVLILKKWLKFHGMNENISTYAITMMAVFVLQVEGYLPSVHELWTAHRPGKVIDGWNTIDYTKEGFESMGKKYRRMTGDKITPLLLKFFRFYEKFDFGTDVICPLLGRTVKKRAFFEDDIHSSLPAEMEPYIQKVMIVDPEKFRAGSKMCVQDPFDLAHNLTKAFQQVESFITLCKLTIEHLVGEKEGSKESTTKSIGGKPVIEKSLGEKVSTEKSLGEESIEKSLEGKSMVKSLKRRSRGKSVGEISIEKS